MEKKKVIHARIKTIDGGNEVAKFTYIGDVKNLPKPGFLIPDKEDYHYGEPMKCELVPFQNTKDDAIVDQFDYYIAPIYNNREQYVGRACMCVDHVMSPIITANVYHSMIEMARKYGDVDSFLADAPNAPIWREEDVSPLNREEWLRKLYVAANREIRDIIKETGLSQAKFGAYFGIPKRTVENWCNGVATPLPYLLIMFQEILGFIDRA